MRQPGSTPSRPWLDLGTVVEVARTQWVTFATFLGAVLLAAGIGSALTEPEYQAVALIHLMPRAGRELNVDEVLDFDATNYMESRERARTQLQIILSRSVREEVVRLYNELGYDDLQPTPEGYETLRRAISAGPREDTQLVEIRVRYGDPDRAAVLANLVAGVYKEGNLEARRDAARETKVWLEGRTHEYRRALEESSDKVLAFKANHDVVDIGDNIDGIASRMQALQNAYGDASTSRVMLETRLAEHERLLRRGQLDVLSGMFDDPTLTALSRERANVVTKAAETLARYGEQHPEHRLAVAHIERVDKLIGEEVKRNIEAERSQVKLLLQQEQRLDREMNEVKVQLLDKQRLQQEFDELRVEYEQARRTYESLGERGTEVDLQAQSRLNDVRIVDWALAPSGPSKPNVPLNMAMALGVGLAGGIGLSLLRHRLDDKVSTTEDVDSILGESLLGVLPTLAGVHDVSNRAMYAFDKPRSLLSESLRGIRAVLVTLIGRTRSRRLVVTSCLEGEGKTFAALGVGIAYAQLGTPVLLVDGDLRRPGLHDLLEIDTDRGLVDALAHPDQVGRYVQPTRVPNLFLLPAGRMADNPGEAMASAELEQVFEKLAETYKVVIVDTPPLAAVADATAPAIAADGVLVVVRRGKVSGDLALGTIRRLRQVGARVLGVVLNDVPPGRNALRYGVGPGPDDAPSGRTAAR